MNDDYFNCWSTTYIVSQKRTAFGKQYYVFCLDEQLTQYQFRYRISVFVTERGFHYLVRHRTFSITSKLFHRIEMTLFTPPTHPTACILNFFETIPQNQYDISLGYTSFCFPYFCLFIIFHAMYSSKFCYCYIFRSLLLKIHLTTVFYDRSSEKRGFYEIVLLALACFYSI